METAITSNANSPATKKRFGRISKSARITFIVQCIQMMKEEGITPYVAIEGLRATGDLNLPGVSTVYKWIQKYNGTRKSLDRKPREVKVTTETKEEEARLEKQWNYVMGHVSSKKMGLSQAHKDLVEGCELFGWGTPLTIHQVYHRWEAIEPIYRDAYIMTHEEHYTKWAGYSRSLKCLPNERWQIDEFQFKLKPKYRMEEVIYGIACVDRASQVCRHIELSLIPIEKVAFLRAMKRSLQANPEMGILSPAKPSLWQMDNARFHEATDPKKAKEAEELTRDVHKAGEDLDITIYHNHNATPRQDCMVENFIGNFKRQLVPHLQYLIQEIAPPETCEQLMAHLQNVKRKAVAFGLNWNTETRKSGESRIDFCLRLALPKSLTVMQEEIDLAVRYTVPRKFTQHGVQFDQDYHYNNPQLLGKRGNEIDIRVQPEGPGATVEAYIGDQYIGTLNRVEDDPNMHQKLNAFYKKLSEQQCEEQKALELKFKDFDRQMEILRQSDPLLRKIILEKREVNKPASRKTAKKQKRESLLAKIDNKPWVPTSCRSGEVTPNIPTPVKKASFSSERL